MLVVDALSDDATPAPGTQRHVRLVPIVTPDSAGTTLIVPF
jgi:hypothetical protein